MNKYKRLASNTMLFAISTFSSKLLTFLMSPLFTYWFATQEMKGVKDLAMQCANLLIPLVSLGISNSVIRFGLEKGIPKQQVFSNGFSAIMAGFVLMILLYPALRLIPLMQDYILYIYIYVLVSCMRTLCCQFCRAKLYNRLYAIDALLCTITTVAFQVLFIAVLDLGAVGYLLSVICGDALSAIFLFVVAGLHRYLGFRYFNKALLFKMLRYSLPLVPASIFWWVTNASDQFFVTAMCGIKWNAIYTSSYVLPSMLSIVASVFTEAWQLSAVTDGQGEGRERFFSKVFGAYQSVMFTAGAGVILMAQPYMGVLREDYFIGWKFMPVLVLATIFSSFDNFLNSVYMVEKRSTLSLVTMAVGAVANCVLNFALIPIWGVNGAAIATFASYFIVFILRVVNTRGLIKINFGFGRMAINLLLVCASGAIMLKQVPYWPLWCTLITVLVAMYNMGNLWTTAARLLGMEKKKKR
ncbi:MAG: polysaccharide biosynthesis C-terminal domain-containing protein [Oscillospiraceae bacterium]